MFVVSSSNKSVQFWPDCLGERLDFWDGRSYVVVNILVEIIDALLHFSTHPVDILCDSIDPSQRSTLIIDIILELHVLSSYIF